MLLEESKTFEGTSFHLWYAGLMRKRHIFSALMSLSPSQSRYPRPMWLYMQRYVDVAQNCINYVFRYSFHVHELHVQLFIQRSILIGLLIQYILMFPIFNSMFIKNDHKTNNWELLKYITFEELDIRRKRLHFKRRTTEFLGKNFAEEINIINTKFNVPYCGMHCSIRLSISLLMDVCKLNCACKMKCVTRT